MKLIKADSKLGITLAKAGVKLRAASPTICLVGGIVGAAGSVVLAARAGMNTKYILDKRMEKRADIEHAFEHQEDLNEPYTPEDKDTDLKTTNREAVIELTKLYAPAVGLWILSMLLIVNSHHILNKRNAALSTALSAAQTTMAAYRERVASFVGDDQENRIWNGERKVMEVDENGEAHETIVNDRTGCSVFDRVFDETNGNWRPEPFENNKFLFDTQKYLNEMLVARSCGGDGIGFIFLNEVYDALGFDRVPEGQYLGWYYELGAHEGYVDFGLRQKDEAHRLFVNGYERSAWLSFNYDGDVVSVMNKRHLKTIVGA